MQTNLKLHKYVHTYQVQAEGCTHTHKLHMHAYCYMICMYVCTDIDTHTHTHIAHITHITHTHTRTHARMHARTHTHSCWPPTAVASTVCHRLVSCDCFQCWTAHNTAPWGHGSAWGPSQRQPAHPFEIHCTAHANYTPPPAVYIYPLPCTYICTYVCTYIDITAVPTTYTVPNVTPRSSPLISLPSTYFPHLTSPHLTSPPLAYPPLPSPPLPSPHHGCSIALGVCCLEGLVELKLVLVSWNVPQHNLWHTG